MVSLVVSCLLVSRRVLLTRKGSHISKHLCYMITCYMARLFAISLLVMFTCGFIFYTLISWGAILYDIWMWSIVCPSDCVKLTIPTLFSALPLQQINILERSASYIHIMHNHCPSTKQVSTLPWLPSCKPSTSNCDLLSTSQRRVRNDRAVFVAKRIA